MWPGSRHQAAAYFQKASGPCSFSTASDASWAHAAVFFRWTDIGIPGYLKIGKCHKKMIENHGQITEKWFKLMEHYSKWFKTKTVQKAWDLGVAYFQTSLIGKQSTNQPFHLKKKLHKALPKCHACSCFVRAMVAPPSGRRSLPAASVGQWNH